MAQAGHLESITADNAHLPTVSVFIVLLALMAALTTYTVPSNDNFQAAKTSLVATFSSTQTSLEPSRIGLAPSLDTALDGICDAFDVRCKPLRSHHLEGRGLLFDADAFDATVSGISSVEKQFLKALVSVVAGNEVVVTLSLPAHREFESANTNILYALLAKSAASDTRISLIYDRALQDTPSLGFLITPQVDQKS
jgi:hypothetical protein